MRIMPIFWGILPTTHSRVRHRNTAPHRLDTAPRRPPSDPMPRRICQPHELLRAQRTPPQPPDVGGDVPSCRASSAAPSCGAAALATVSTRAAAAATMLLQSCPCLWRCPAGVFRGSELRFGLAIIPVIVTMNLPNRHRATGGRARRERQKSCA